MQVIYRNIKIFFSVGKGKWGKCRGKSIASHNKSLHAWRHQFASGSVPVCTCVFLCVCVSHLFPHN